MSGTIADATGPAESAFLDLHKKFIADKNPEPGVCDLAQAALARFEALGFPRSKHEMYTFAHTKNMVSTAFALPAEAVVAKEVVPQNVYAGCENSVLVVVDGQYRPDLSDISALADSLSHSSIAEALAEPAVKEYFLESIEEENDVFASLNSAFLGGGVALKIADDVQPQAPLQILYVSTGSEAQAVVNHPRLFLRVGKLSELKLIVRTVGVQGNYLVNAVQDILLDEGAGVTFSQVQEDRPDAWHFSKTRITQQANSRFFGANASYGSRLTRHHYDARLQAAGAELTLHGVSVLNDEEQVHNFIRIHHEAPHTTSSQLFKNIVDGKSRSSMDGTVIVCEGAQLVSSDQLINNLMLSDEAHADNKPNLMIFADDVKCTHGATVGQIDEEQLFYLKTRGLSENIAKELLTRSFAESVIQTIEFPEVVADLQKNLLKKLQQ